MIIDKHTINTLRTLAHQCAEAHHQAGIHPPVLLALLDAFEEREKLANAVARIAHVIDVDDVPLTAQETETRMFRELANEPEILASRTIVETATTLAERLEQLSYLHYQGKQL